MAWYDPHTCDWITVKHTETGATTEIPPKSIDSYRDRGWVPVEEDPPTSKATVGEWREYATAQDPENTEAITAMTKDQLREQYGS